MQEKKVASIHGGTVLLLLIGWAALVISYQAISGNQELLCGISLVLAALLLPGFFIVQPNQAKVLQLFGDYRGTERKSGLRWANPLFSAKCVSLRTRNFICERIKVNDRMGNPIEIAAAIVWRVEDTALATFGVEDYEAYLHIQSESALRHLASCHAYDTGEAGAQGEALTLRGNGDEIGALLQQTLQRHLSDAGLVVVDAKITYLAYAPEIAHAMLRRQQAAAVLAARRIIVDGAVSMVEMALNSMSERKIVELDEERRAAMVSNLLVVLCSDKEAAPVINSGTLYG